jgi:tetratricopeptide (TPR) repeat protein
MKPKKSPSKSIVIPLILLFSVQAITLAFLLIRVLERQSQRTEILKRIDEYYGKGELDIAESLAVNLMASEGRDADALGWLDKISSAKKQLNAPSTPKEDVRIVETGGDTKLLKEQTAALNNLKKTIDEMKKDQSSTPLVINTLKDTRGEDGANKTKVRPEDLGRFLTTGIGAYKSGDYQSAESNLLKVVAVDEKNPSANSYLGATYFSENPQSEEKLKNALSYSKKALESDKSNKLAYATLGQVYEAKGNRELAVINYLEAVTIDPKDDGLLFKIGRLYYFAHDLEKASEYLSRALKINDEIPFAYYYLGLIDKANSDKPRAIQSFTDAVRTDPEFYGAFLERAETFFSMGDYGKAVEDFRNAISIKDGFLLRCRIGDCYRKMGQPEDALNEFRQALETQTVGGKDERARGLEASAYVIDALLKKGNQDDAYRVIRIVLGKGMEEPDIYLAKARIEEARKTYEEAEDSLKNVLRLDPASLDGHCELAMLYLNTGRKNEAVGFFREFVNKNPSVGGNKKVIDTLEALKK